MTEFGRYLKQCPAALKDKTRTLSLLKDALKNDLPKFRVLQAAYELGILEAIQRSNPISTDDRLKITTGLVSQYAMLENAAKNAILSLLRKPWGRYIFIAKIFLKNLSRNILNA